MDEYLELLEIKKDFDKKAKEISNENLENLKALHNRLELKYYHIETENRMIKLKNDSLKWDVKELKMFNENIRNELILRNEKLDYIEKTWWYKLFF